VPGRRCHAPGLYAWKRRPPSERELADRELAERIRQIYLDTDEIYGAPRIYSELKLGNGIAVAKKRVARLMRQLGLRGADGRRGGPRTTVRDPKRLSAPDLVDRDFARAEPNRLWVRPEVHPDRARFPLPRRRPGRLQPPDHRLVDA
jgi:putative transposase